MRPVRADALEGALRLALAAAARPGAAGAGAAAFRALCVRGAPRLQAPAAVAALTAAAQAALAPKGTPTLGFCAVVRGGGIPPCCRAG